MPFGWVGSCDPKRTYEKVREELAESPMPFGWVGSCDPVQRLHLTLGGISSPMPFGWVGSCDMKKQSKPNAPAPASPMPFGWVGSCDVKTVITLSAYASLRLQCLSAGWGVVTVGPRLLAVGGGQIVSNAFRLGGEL